MDPLQQALSLIHRGCRLAKDLEARLGDLANQPETLYKSCDNIVNMFASAKEMLNNVHPQQQTDPSLQELLNYGVITQAMDMIQSGRTSISIGEEIQAMEVSDSGIGSSSSSQHSHRSRKHDEEKCRMRVPAPQMGNTDLPPEDNYTWRKYGQKEILGSRYPRAYYRCTHQKMYNCPAKKQVQRLDNDFYTFEVTYIGQHTCHMSSTAPSIAPPSSTPLIQDPMVMVSQPTLPPTSSSSAAPLGTWLSMEFSLDSGSSSGGRGGGDAGASSAAGGGGASMGSRYGREAVEFPAVADMADAMFNSGSSSSNSMDFIFPQMDDKWEAGDKAN
ncbi:WRKY DNA-binding protein 70, putative isoform 1 [Hibiscus syriacus]|uniref:WRKY DNA-binding protein 70, putative isoform 1 n=1 Tax=Hibiscus syriacus TaxID=106335 RepID=A0A6A3D2R6_HIBSY|nr:WRKY transcription factor 55-like [Hibiscus syriacus]KAE8735776.1 WRKY DNA-binding protein 70, putative isoform 1 [Hibiscus syriacus]